MHFHLALFDTRQLDICVNNHISLGKAAFQCFVTVRLMFAEGNSYNLPTDVVMFLIAKKGLNLWGIRFECFNRVVNSRKHFVFYFNSLDGFSCDCLCLRSAGKQGACSKSALSWRRFRFAHRHQRHKSAILLCTQSCMHIATVARVGGNKIFLTRVDYLDRAKRFH